MKKYASLRHGLELTCERDISGNHLYKEFLLCLYPLFDQTKEKIFSRNEPDDIWMQ